jgi:XTP/dITP diphosphohydrolase
MKLILASGNRHKAAELQAMSRDLARLPRGGIEVVSAASVGGMPPVVEDTGTFVGNAGKKARALHALLPPGSWSLADDSGICVDALGGLPGVDSAYYAGPEADPAANLAKLVEAMRGVPEGRRGAAFVCVLALLSPSGDLRIFEGRVEGRLADLPRGSGGFGYDPLFIPEGLDVTMAELLPAEKNRLSHRGRAWSACVGWLAEQGQTVL